MFTIARDENNDIYLDGKGQLATVSDVNATVQIVDARVKTVMGELYLIRNRGIPYFATVLKHRKFLPIWEDSMREAIQSCNGVYDIKRFEYAISGNELFYEAEIVTTERIRALYSSSLTS